MQQKKTLDLLDWIEERRMLTSLEASFRNILKRKIAFLIHLIAIAARQIGKVTWCTLGDEDSRFYHARASARLRQNKIKVIESGGIHYFTHKEKERIFTDYYRAILGSEATIQPLIEFREVYTTQLNLSHLSHPFTEQEVYKALRQIPRDKCPGPDGFGSAVYHDFWDIVKPEVFNFFHQFFHEQSQLERNNRSFIVLLKKKEDACTPDAYRPISLLNCSVKLVTKVLALRLQAELQNLVDDDQTGFVLTRCIADNFIYALDLVQACKQRKKKTIVLKLDFPKAFDTVSWDSLLTILQVRGFDTKWIRWMQMLTTTAKTAILLNGNPGPWIPIKRGLRQGDPLSPLLFIIMVDVLQQIIKKFSCEGLLKHPVVPDQPCPVIQYADDTLILIQGDNNQARLLKEILEAFSTSTGLAINYTKSTFVPLNLDETEQIQISNILENLYCKRWTYALTRYPFRVGG
jgi:retron-type reverse transcriptase